MAISVSHHGSEIDMAFDSDGSIIGNTISFGRQCVNLYKWNEPPAVRRWLMVKKDMLLQCR